jgi:transcriptional regulator with XRE-family HTH domain
MSEKRTFLQIRARHNVSLEALAREAQVSVEDIYYLEAGVPYSAAFIEKALAALAVLTGEQCTRETVGGIYEIDEEEEGGHE